MSLTRIFRPRLLVVSLLAGIAGLGVYGHAASNTVPATKLGGGAGAATGYTVSNVAYILNAANPANVDGVQFDLDASASAVHVQLVTAGAWFSCAVSGTVLGQAATATHPVCTTAGVTAATADNLTVVARS
jgi:hypothetical protein